MKFSVVLPIHNEAPYLPYSLPSIFRLRPTQIVFLFDRCTDDSMKICSQLSKKYGYANKTCPIIVKWNSSFKSKIGYLRWLGQSYTSEDYILYTGADLILDPSISTHLSKLEKNNVHLISFLHRDYPIKTSIELKRLFVKIFKSQRSLGPVLFYNKKTAELYEDLNSLKEIESAEDTHLHRSITKKHKSTCILTNTLHLRPRGSQYDFFRGRLYWSVSHRSLFTALFGGFLFFSPQIIAGYLHERLKDTGTKVFCVKCRCYHNPKSKRFCFVRALFKNEK